MYHQTLSKDDHPQFFAYTKHHTDVSQRVFNRTGPFHHYYKAKGRIFLVKFGKTYTVAATLMDG